MVGVLGAVGAGAGINITIRAVDKFSKTFNRANSGMRKLGKGIAIGAFAMTAAVAGMGIAAVKTAADFETAFTGVRKTVDLTEEEFKTLENTFKTLSTEIPITFVELSHIGEIAGQLGVEGVDNILKFSKTIADISVSTNLSAEQAATDFARIANVMGVPISEIDKMGSAIVDLGNNFATSEGEIVAMTMRIMGAGKTIGLNTQEVFGMSAALSALGIRSEMGGSAISRAMITISKSIAKGGDELEKYAEVSGMTIEEFSTAWKEKPVEAMSAVIMGLKNITDEGGNTFGVLEDLDLKSIRITDTMLRLAGSEDGITKAVELSKKAWEENTALVEEAEKRYATFDSQVKMLGNSTKLLFADLGEELIPVLLDLFKVIKDDVLPAIEPLIPIIGDALIKVIKMLAPHLPKLAELFGRIVDVGMKLFDALMPLLEPLMEIGFVLLDSILDAIIPLIPAIAQMARAFTPLLKILAPIVGFLGDVLEFLTKIWGGVIGGAYKAVGNLFGLPEVTQVGDAIIRPNGQIIKTHPQDTLIATKNPGGVTLIIEGNVYGTDPDEMAEAIAMKIDRSIKI